MMKHLLRMSGIVALILSIASCSGSGTGTSVATNAEQTITRLGETSGLRGMVNGSQSPHTAHASADLL